MEPWTPFPPGLPFRENGDKSPRSSSQHPTADLSIALSLLATCRPAVVLLILREMWFLGCGGVDLRWGWWGALWVLLSAQALAAQGVVWAGRPGRTESGPPTCWRRDRMCSLPTFLPPCPVSCPLASACRSPPAPRPLRPRRPASPLASAAPRPRSVTPTCPGTQGGSRFDQRGMRMHPLRTKETSWAPTAAVPQTLTSSLLMDKEPRRGWGVTVSSVLCPRP